MDMTDYTSEEPVFRWSYINPVKKVIRSWVNVLRQPVYTAHFRTYISETMRSFSPRLVLSGAGIPLEQARRNIRRLADRPIKRLLIAGCGDGAAIGEWLRLRPEETLAVDLFRFDRAWQEATTVARSKGYKVDFVQADLSDLHGILEDGWADAIITEAVFEHCKDLESVLREFWRVLRCGGMLYASYGPLWYSAGGDHFSGRGGLATAYNHLILTGPEYQAYFKSHLLDDEAVQDGGRYVPLDLFSKLAPREYLELYSQTDFAVEDLVAEVSPVGVRFRQAHPTEWRQLQRAYPHLWEEEFLIKGHWIWLRKECRSR